MTARLPGSAIRAASAFVNNDLSAINRSLYQKDYHMKNSAVYLALAALISGIMSCSKDNSTTSPGPVTDQQAVTQIVTSVDSVAQFLSSEEATINDGGLQLVTAGGAVLPGEVRSQLGVLSTTRSDSVVEWGRSVNVGQITRDYNVVLIGDTVAIVTITKQVPGELLVAWGTHPSPSSDSVVIDTIVHKPFTEVMKRKVELKRIARDTNPLRNWVLVAITIVTAKTEGSITFGIDSLQIADAHVGYDSTFYTPLQTWFRFGRYRESIPVFHAGDTVTVRLSVSGSDSLPEIVTFHHGIAGSGSLPFRVRMSLISQTGGPGNRTRIFQRKFLATLPPSALLARFNALADVFPKRCVYVDSSRYENEFWGLPYIVVR
jgi:hypothetical protein